MCANTDMGKEAIEDRIFEQKDFSSAGPDGAEYENCSFVQCDFSNADLSRIVFTTCTFEACNLSMAKIVHTAFREVKFKDSKLLGLHFDECNAFLFSVSFDHCILNLSSFFRVKLRKASFCNSSLVEVDFTEADLNSAVFDNCDLSGALFDRTILEKADLRAAYHYSINPETNKIKKAKFSLNGIPGLLGKYDIVIE